ncbi:MAG: dTDP-4-dehydrorhamnose 3,5-epimerase [Planctomycetota bacterium]|nr:MAG: dTDP-4-dehydrorhamnose 3,5-epimerase [Planctomycetota bacterium]
MKRIDTALPGVLLLEPRVFEDARGHFFETYRADTFASMGIGCAFVQDNQSFSRRGVLRGLHYQLGRPQAKLIRVVQGEIFDVAVDVRRGSPTFGKWAGEVLSSTNHRQMFVPAGFAHGFLVLSETAEVTYKCSDLYAPAEERGIAWNDPKIGIGWPLQGAAPLINEKDARYPALDQAPDKDLPRY